MSKVLEKSNPDLVKQIAKKHFNVSDPTKWYANNCIFKTDGLKYKYKEFLAEGDKTIMIFKQFVIASLNFMFTSPSDVKSVMLAHRGGLSSYLLK